MLLISHDVAPSSVRVRLYIVWDVGMVVVVLHCVLHCTSLTARASAQVQLMSQNTPMARVLNTLVEVERKALTALDEPPQRYRRAGSSRSSNTIGNPIIDHHQQERRAAVALPERESEELSIRQRYKKWKSEWKERRTTTRAV